MTLVSHIGKKLFYLGFRMQPLRIRRGISLMMAIGMEWERQNKDILERAMNGEDLDLEVNLKTIERVEEEA